MRTTRIPRGPSKLTFNAESLGHTKITLTALLLALTKEIQVAIRIYRHAIKHSNTSKVILLAKQSLSTVNSLSTCIAFSGPPKKASARVLIGDVQFFIASRGIGAENGKHISKMVFSRTKLVKNEDIFPPYLNSISALVALPC